MMGTWLECTKRESTNYRFSVVDSIELRKPDESLLNYLARNLVLAYQNPEMLRREYRILAQDMKDLDLQILKQFVEEEILPSRDRIMTRIGNFGEIVAAIMLVDFEGYWFPIHKLRFREKKDWAVRLTDLCVFKVDGREIPLVCYGEVKTKTSGRDFDLAVKGHVSLSKDDALTYPEILRFMCTWLYEKDMHDAGELLSRIRLGKITYDRKHVLFLLHNRASWTDIILDRLGECELDERLIDFTLYIVLVEDLRNLIEAVYDHAWIGAAEVLHG
jgi:hypothetical protein